MANQYKLTGFNDIKLPNMCQNLILQNFNISFPLIVTGEVVTEIDDKIRFYMNNNFSVEQILALEWFNNEPIV